LRWFNTYEIGKSSVVTFGSDLNRETFGQTINYDLNRNTNGYLQDYLIVMKSGIFKVT